MSCLAIQDTRDKVSAIEDGTDRIGARTMAGNGDMKAHVATYSSVTGMMKWGAVGCALVVALVIWLIS
ncbi:aa3 type cytochrome c oxidase subunit IV [Sphingomonas faeni]|uniref:Aa3 type cytochrome c oxidase subunit IV n=1 Tax=Sphingomonas faeni TaxID=185950 RepID=A0A2T5U5P9_9SPHN|nr:aa3 type cytochrome c oxidase subunit IV [Sphingomonas faeni]